MGIDLGQFKLLVEDLARETEETRAVLKDRIDELRRCVATRADSLPCEAWAVWNAPGQLCASHLYPKRRKADEMTDEVRKRQRRRKSPVCQCPAYAWPHRRGNGLCKWPDEPDERWPTPAGSRRLGKMSRGKLGDIRRKFGI